jgi:hypothetical protein
VVYGAFGALVVGAALAAEWRGWTFARPRQQQVVPRSVRENPGAYRAVYRGPYRYLRGK